MDLHVKFTDYVKYYQQNLAKFAPSTGANERKRIRCLFLDYLAYTYPYYRKFFLDLGGENIEFVLECLSYGKGCSPYKVVTGFNSLCYPEKM